MQGATDPMTAFLGHTKQKRGSSPRLGTGVGTDLVIPGIFQGVDKSIPCLGSLNMTAFICQILRPCVSKIHLLGVVHSRGYSTQRRIKS